MVAPRKYIAEDFHRVAAERGGRCVTVPKVTRDVGMWECSEGHVFPMVAGTVLHLGGWCPHCKRQHRTAGNARRTARPVKGGRISTFFLMGIEK